MFFILNLLHAVPMRINEITRTLLRVVDKKHRPERQAPVFVVSVTIGIA